MPFKLRDWQKIAKEKWMATKSGIVEVVTGGGKTIFALECARDILENSIETKVLVIVPTQALADQWFIEIISFFSFEPCKVQFLESGKVVPENHIFAICIINSARLLAEEYCKKFPTFLVVDECHRAGSPENAKALRGQHKATLGLSATPEREYDDGFERYIVPSLGPIIYRYDYIEAARDKVIAPFSLVNLEIELLQDERVRYKNLSKRIAIAYAKGNEDAIEALLRQRSAVSMNAVMRIPVAASLVERHRGSRIVLFHERTDAADNIHANLKARGHRVTIYHSGIGADLRRDNLRLFRKGHFDVLVCCKALDEGINVPETEVGILASSTASSRQRIQRLGRLLRPAPGKDSAIIYTLFATKEEQDRLRVEEKHLQGITNTNWKRARLARDA